MVIVRGPQHDLKTVHQLVHKMIPHVQWNFDAISLYASTQTALKSEKIDDSVTIITNRSHIIELLDFILRKAYIMMETEAYLHWYSRYGCDRKYFDSCMALLQDVIVTYVGLVQN